MLITIQTHHGNHAFEKRGYVEGYGLREAPDALRGRAPMLVLSSANRARIDSDASLEDVQGLVKVQGFRIQGVLTLHEVEG